MTAAGGAPALTRQGSLGSAAAGLSLDGLSDMASLGNPAEWSNPCAGAGGQQPPAPTPSSSVFFFEVSGPLPPWTVHRLVNAMQVRNQNYEGGPVLGGQHLWEPCWMCTWSFV